MLIQVPKRPELLGWIGDFGNEWAFFKSFRKKSIHAVYTV